MNPRDEAAGGDLVKSGSGLATREPPVNSLVLRGLADLATACAADAAIESHERLYQAERRELVDIGRVIESGESDERLYQELLSKFKRRAVTLFRFGLDISRLKQLVLQSAIEKLDETHSALVLEKPIDELTLSTATHEFLKLGGVTKVRMLLSRPVWELANIAADAIKRSDGDLLKTCDIVSESFSEVRDSLCKLGAIPPRAPRKADLWHQKEPLVQEQPVPRQFTREELWQVTCHEAGHAVVGVRLEIPFLYVERGDGEHGEVPVGVGPLENPGRSRSPSEISRWQQFYAAGAAAEQLLFEGYRDYWASRDKFLHEQLEKLRSQSRADAWDQDVRNALSVLDRESVEKVARALDHHRKLTDVQVYELLDRVPSWY
jgi:hypothetical protein